LAASYGAGIGAIGLTYEYTPARTGGVPGPGSLVLLGVGLGLLAWRAGRARSRGAGASERSALSDAR